MSNIIYMRVFRYDDDVPIVEGSAGLQLVLKSLTDRSSLEFGRV